MAFVNDRQRKAYFARVSAGQERFVRQRVVREVPDAEVVRVLQTRRDYVVYVKGKKRPYLLNKLGT